MPSPSSAWSATPQAASTHRSPSIMHLADKPNESSFPPNAEGIFMPLAFHAFSPVGNTDRRVGKISFALWPARHAPLLCVSDVSLALGQRLVTGHGHDLRASAPCLCQ